MIPVILRPCSWEEIPCYESGLIASNQPKLLLGNLDALPEKAKPVTSWQSQDEAFLDVVNGIKALLLYRNYIQIEELNGAEEIDKDTSSSYSFFSVDTEKISQEASFFQPEQTQDLFSELDPEISLDSGHISDALHESKEQDLTDFRKQDLSSWNQSNKISPDDIFSVNLESEIEQEQTLFGVWNDKMQDFLWIAKDKLSDIAQEIVKALPAPW